MALPSVTLPPRLEAVLAARQTMEDAQIWFAPIRHHSPACAYALRALIADVRPDHILIEGPGSLTPVIPSLLDEQTRPPVAVMCGTREKTAEDAPPPRAAYFPFCEYSPEWQALRAGQETGAATAFIDLPWSVQSADEEDDENGSGRTRSLQKERYLAHSLFISRLAKTCRCRDHDELWEHLFELRTTDALSDWSAFFGDTLVWCAMARHDYEPEVLEKEGSLRREAHMLAHIRRVKQQQPQARIVVVTGGFHTSALLEGLTEAGPPPFTLSAAQEKAFSAMQSRAADDSAWLIRYSFDRLDALNGYASGMPSPAWYQRSWESLMQQQDRAQNGIAFLTDVARTLREKEADDPPDYLTVRHAAEQSLLLAQLRDHPVPGRYDLLDGLQSTFIKGSLDESRQLMWDTVRRCFSGWLLGRIPPGTLTPPLVSETYARAEALRFKLGDTLPKTAKLDIYRNPQHQLRSRFLHLLAFLGVPFARKIQGPDFAAGHQLDLLFETWEYAWTPNTEGELITLAEKGTQLTAVALRQLLEMENDLEKQGRNRSSRGAVELLINAALTGLHQRIPTLFALLDRYILDDFRLDSLTACAHQLVHLWRCREFLGIEPPEAITGRLRQILPQIFFCLDQLTQEDEQQQETHLQALLSLQELIGQLPDITGSHDDRQNFYQHLARLDGRLGNVPLIRGATDALRYLDNQISHDDLMAALDSTFSPGSDPAQAVAYFTGLMRAAPELVIRLPLLTTRLNQYLAQWDEEKFIRVLPELRFAFSQLTPKQNADLADYVAGLTGLNPQTLDVRHSAFSEAQMLDALRLDKQLRDTLTADDLQDWFTTGEHP